MCSMAACLLSCWLEPDDADFSNNIDSVGAVTDGDCVSTTFAGCEMCCGVVTTGEDFSREVSSGEAGGMGEGVVVVTGWFILGLHARSTRARLSSLSFSQAARLAASRSLALFRASILDQTSRRRSSVVVGLRTSVISFFNCSYCWFISANVFCISTILSCVSLFRMLSCGVSTAPSELRFLRFGVSTCSSRAPYWAAQLFCEYQSGGRLGSPMVFKARETDIQFWSPLRTTADARQSCSRTFHVSRGTRFICSLSCIELI
ncbi:unnamed protein product [Chrysodeixis includens]|uniref:Uncharacterized protein n=1 Tax=Chrysodeixis includens TaxID=689277 RepID=A0A9N8KX98_CHRIL|nr:unnamed protein product [Chrysodeixis includens]